MAKTTLIADVDLIRHLQRENSIPKNGFHLELPEEEFANILFACYINCVEERGRVFIRTPKLEEAIWEIAGKLTTPSYRFGMILTGSCGNGKTTMLRAIRKAIFYIMNVNSKIIPDYCNLARSVPMISAKDIIENILVRRANYMEPDILMIDDLGSEPTEVVHYTRIHTPLIDLLEARYARQKVTFISTNLSLTELGTKYKGRLADRFDEMMWDVAFTDDSFRF